jgi:hypothetical protein
MGLILWRMRYTDGISVLRQRCAFCSSLTQHKSTNWCLKCTALRSELELTRANLKDCLAQRDRYHSDLATAEMRLDRLQSRTVQAVHGRAQSPPKEVTVKEEEGVEENEGDAKEEPRMSSSPPVSGQFIGGSLSNFTLPFHLI